MQDSLIDTIWDAVALARDLKCYEVGRNDDGSVRYGVSMIIDLPPEMERRLKDDALKNRVAVVKRLRHTVKWGLRRFFGDEHE